MKEEGVSKDLEVDTELEESRKLGCGRRKNDKCGRE